MLKELTNKIKKIIPEIEIKKINNDYFIDNLGNIYSRPRERVLGGIVRHRVNSYGYKTVRLIIDGVNRTKMVHRLLAEAFIPNSKNKSDINHKDGNKQNNSLNNLEWCSKAENNQHAIDTGLRSKISASGEKYIYLDNATKRYKVRISFPNNKSRDLGRFENLSEAINARDNFLSTNKVMKL